MTYPIFSALPIPKGGFQAPGGNMAPKKAPRHTSIRVDFAAKHKAHNSPDGMAALIREWMIRLDILTLYDDLPEIFIKLREEKGGRGGRRGHVKAMRFDPYGVDIIAQSRGSDTCWRMTVPAPPNMRPSDFLILIRQREHRLEGIDLAPAPVETDNIEAAVQTVMSLPPEQRQVFDMLGGLHEGEDFTCLLEGEALRNFIQLMEQEGILKPKPGGGYQIDSIRYWQIAGQISPVEEEAMPAETADGAISPAAPVPETRPGPAPPETKEKGMPTRTAATPIAVIDPAAEQRELEAKLAEAETEHARVSARQLELRKTNEQKSAEAQGRRTKAKEHLDAAEALEREVACQLKEIERATAEARQLAETMDRLKARLETAKSNNTKLATAQKAMEEVKKALEALPPELRAYLTSGR